MGAIKWIKTFPGDRNYKHFEALLVKLYTEEELKKNFFFTPLLKDLFACFVLLHDEEIVGRFALYLNEKLKYNDQKVMTIGSYECINDFEISELLLEKASSVALSEGVEFLIGPMEGSTWNSYRFCANNNGGTFFMEPYHHSYYNQHFSRNGFMIIGEYISNLNDSLDFDLSELKKQEERYKADGAIFRNLCLESVDHELKKIGEFCIEGFNENFLYSPITIDEFLDKNKGTKQLLNTDFVQLVEDENGNLHALIFGIVDFKDEKKETVIIKTLVRRKSSKFKGIGDFLAYRLMQTAKENGMNKVIHAFMYQNNFSAELSNRDDTKRCNTYFLYGKKI